MENKQAALEALLKQAPVVPVMVIDDIKQAVPLARALVAGGLPVLEITLRTEAAIDAMKAIMAEVEGAVVGAGTVLTPQQFRQCAKLGCAFAVSPGSTGKLLGEAEDYECRCCPVLPRRQKYWPCWNGATASKNSSPPNPQAARLMCHP
jgi:2-dehydro-3-deoxyphosphogluconate aldolase / (4S)-4-hydroxy-2-oxoglutarate aldolase